MNTPNGGYIKIEVGNPNKESGTDSSQSNPPPPARDVTANPSPSSTESPVAKARRLQAEGRYSEAIAAYREAIGQGRTDGDTYLGIAQSYHRLGDSGAARGAYYDAIRAYESQIAAGRSTNAAQQGIVTCRAALELIGN
jgi:tetratricopeptide (TPR) repeat protein